MKPHRIVLLGPPAAGKGTQGQLIIERWRLPVVSAGDVLRAEIAAGTPRGQEAARYMNDGGLVPDAVAVGAVEGWLTAHGDEFVFDGFPRTVGQADALEAMLAKYDRSLTAVLWLEITPEEIAHRVSRRVVCADCGRSFQVGSHVADRQAACPVCGGKLTVRRDDAAAALTRRLEEYNAHTRPLKAHYEARGLLHHIDAGQPTENVFEQICDAAGLSRVEAIEAA